LCAGAVLEPHFFAASPRGPQGHPRAPKRRPTAPQGSPRAPQGSPRAPQRSPRASQGGPRGSQRSLRAPQGSAKAPQREPNGCKEGPSNSKYIAKLPINRPSGRYVNLSYRDTLAQQLGRRPAKPMGSSRVGSTPTGVVFCRCRFVCLQGLHVCIALMPNIAFLCPGKKNASPPATCFPDSRKPLPETRRVCQRDMAQRARADGLSPQPANCKCAGHILSSELLIDLPSQTLGITLHQPA
jgi:hypothetical protein